MDYFSFGLPVVTTWVGARGIDGVDSKDFIACDEKDFLNKIEYLLNSPGQRETMGSNARRLAEDIYDWKKISSRLACILNDILKFGEVVNCEKPTTCLKK